MNDINAIAQHMKKQADRILSESSLIEIASEYGVPHITGSYTLDVMLRPDLDVYVVAQEDNLENALNVLHALLHKNFFDSTWFVSHVDKELPTTSIRGYYIQPHKTLDDIEWKLDVWLIKNDQFDDMTSRFLERINHAPNPDHVRQMILALKDHFREGKKYQGNISGQKIYQAVLDNQDAELPHLIELVGDLR